MQDKNMNHNTKKNILLKVTRMILPFFIGIGAGIVGMSQCTEMQNTYMEQKQTPGLITDKIAIVNLE